jgi:hypothetical protein
MSIADYEIQKIMFKFSYLNIYTGLCRNNT